MQQDTELLIQTLKKLLKNQGITYRTIASHLNLSEASVKRLFSQNDLSLKRVEQITNLAGYTFLDLLELMQEDKAYITTLTPEQEVSLLQDPYLLLVTFLLVNHWKLNEIVENYAIEAHRLTGILAKLDRLKIIELLPNNRVKLLTARNFTWRKRGPVQTFIHEQIIADFFKSKFDQQQQDLRFVGGLMSESSHQKAIELIEQFIKSFDQLMAADLKLPLASKKSYGCAIAYRDWEFTSFRQMRRLKQS